MLFDNSNIRNIHKLQNHNGLDLEAIYMIVTGDMCLDMVIISQLYLKIPSCIPLSNQPYTNNNMFFHFSIYKIPRSVVYVTFKRAG